MRERLAQMFVEQAQKDPNFVILSGDHGYALFDPIRQHCPEQFINVGVAEQSLIGYAAGLAKLGMKPVVYGLASFVPMRVLEQIRLDICFSNSKVIILGDGAGLVYSTLGTSHQCTEDIAVTRVLPNLKVFSPCDQFELEDCFNQALQEDGPCYIRLGKADRPAVFTQLAGNTCPRWSNQRENSDALLISTGSFSAPSKEIAKEFNLSSISLAQLSPLPIELIGMIKSFKKIICLEEHNRNGGLYSAILDFLSQNEILNNKQVASISIDNKFNQFCGSYEYALSEHQLTDSHLMDKVRHILQLWE
jgi:transketolase